MYCNTSKRETTQRKAKGSIDNKFNQKIGLFSFFLNKNSNPIFFLYLLLVRLWVYTLVYYSYTLVVLPLTEQRAHNFKKELSFSSSYTVDYQTQLIQENLSLKWINLQLINHYLIILIWRKKIVFSKVHTLTLIYKFVRDKNLKYHFR